MLHVTDVIRIASLSPAPDFIPAYAFDRGRAVHRATELSDVGTLDEATVAPEVAPYLAAWRRFRDELAFDVLGAETAVVGQGYVGTFDRLIRFPGDARKTIIEIKCGEPAPWHAIQTAAYALACYEPLNRGAVYLTPDARYRWVAHENRDDAATFRAALVVAAWKTANGLAIVNPR